MGGWVTGRNCRIILFLDHNCTWKILGGHLNTLFSPSCSAPLSPLLLVFTHAPQKRNSIYQNGRHNTWLLPWYKHLLLLSLYLSQLRKTLYNTTTERNSTYNHNKENSNSICTEECEKCTRNLTLWGPNCNKKSQKNTHPPRCCVSSVVFLCVQSTHSTARKKNSHHNAAVSFPQLYYCTSLKTAKCQVIPVTYSVHFSNFLICSIWTKNYMHT